MRLRHALIPYLYTMAWRNTQSALPLVTPMYYSHPESPGGVSMPTAVLVRQRADRRTFHPPV
jgi:alpha-glucosidase (family GH31 glycosyl hydrolase)